MQCLSKETLDLIQETAVKANGATGKADLIHPAQEPEHVYYLVTPTGKPERVEAAPEPRGHAIVTCEEVCEFVDMHKSDSTAVWFGRDAVVVLLDDTTRRDRAELTLIQTPQLKLLAELGATARNLEPKKFRRMLRVDLGDCLNDLTLLNWVSNFKASSGSATQVMLGKSKESLGREVQEAAVNESGECPDEILLSVRVFDDPGLTIRRPIRCAVDVDISGGEAQFRLSPFPLEIHKAIEDEVLNIGQLLRSTLTDVKVFRGTP